MHARKRFYSSRLASALALAGLGSCAAWAQCTGAAPAPNASAAEIVSLSGQGQTRPTEAQPWLPAARTQQLSAGADMRTLALSSAALLLADRTQIRMSANAQLRLCQAQPSRTLLELAAGRLWARTKKIPANLELQTPAALAVVRGTDWDVEVDNAGRTTLTVLSGRVDLSNNLGQVLLGPSEQGFVEPGKAPVKRVLVQARERVQWVMASTLQSDRWPELRAPNVSPELAAVRSDIDVGRWEAARQRLQTLSQTGTGGPVVERMLADLEASNAQLEAAQERLARSWQRAPEPRTAARRAELLMALDRNDEARRWLDATHAQAVGSADWLMADGDWLRLQGQGAAAIGRYREAVARADTPAQQAAAHEKLGRALQERGDVRAAGVELARAVALAPNQATYWGEQATAQAENLQLGAAQSNFDRALALTADDYVSLAGRGLLALQQGQAEAARRDLLRALVIEPRYARAQMWLAVAEYTLGERAAALDSLDRASAADPNDPLPWQLRAIMQNDSGAPADAIAAAREALARLPYLKSLNPLASDSQGSANLGKALGDFGLENWARAYANASYNPLWAGSHFFLADRYESDFSRRSELFQGYLTDPTVFGASEKRAPLLLSQNREISAGASVERNPLRHNATGDVGFRGFDASVLPVAWLVRGSNVDMWPRDGAPSTRYRLQSPGIDVALGSRPNESLALFATYTDTGLDYRFPDGLDFGNGITFNQTAHTHTRRGDVGASWRWSADSQTWVKAHHARQSSALVLDDALFGPQNYHFSSDEQGVFVRHTVQWGPHRISLGWEDVRRDTASAIADATIVTPRTNTERYSQPWVAGEWRHGPWQLMAEAYWPVFEARQQDRFTDTAGTDLLPPIDDGAQHRRRLRPRLGLSHSFGPGRALHVAYQESLRAPGTHTLAPVATGAIPIDNQYLLAGSLSRKKAAQLDWEWDSRTFLGAMVSHQTINNLQAANGRLFAQNTAALFDNVSTLAPVVLNAQTTLNAYDQTPLFSQGRLSQASVSINRVLAPRWSVLGHYLYSHSRNTGNTFAGSALPGFPRDTLLAQTTWRHSERGFSLARLTWRGARFQDEANALPQPPGWSLALAHGWESTDRRWSVTATAQGELRRDAVAPTLWMLVRYRD